MSSRCLLLATIVAALGSIALHAAPQPAQTPVAPAPSPTTAPPATTEIPEPPPPPPLPRGMPADLPARLSALRPGNPDAYLRLGEDVAAAAQDNRGRELARTLFGLAFTLDRRRASATVFPSATSAALALAELASTETDRKWYISLARSLDRRLTSPAWTSRGQDQADSSTAYLAAVYVGLVRAGDSIKAQRVLAQPGVRELIHRYERLLSPVNDTGGLLALEQEMSRWPCPECAGKRIVRKFQSIPPQFRLCVVCGGTLGPTLRPEELAAQLRFEARLLSGTARSWAAQIISDGGTPLRDVDPDELPAALGIDPDASLWRGGRWVAEPPPPQAGVQTPP